jgi:hypothetical protein
MILDGVSRHVERYLYGCKPSHATPGEAAIPSSFFHPIWVS